MPQIEKTVFISYRHTNIFTALAVYQSLTTNGYDVFMGSEGDDFDALVLSNIIARGHFIVILTLSALQYSIDPDDPFRREIEYALDNQRHIIPLLLSDYEYDSPIISKYLTGKLELLKNYPSISVSADTLSSTINLVQTNYLNQPVDITLKELTPNAKEITLQRQDTFNKKSMVTSGKLQAEALYESGNQHVYHFRYDDAIEDYSGAIRLVPEYTNFHNIRGLAYHQKRQFKKAIADFEKAITLDPHNAILYMNRATCFASKSATQSAFQAYDKALDIDRTQPLIYLNVANLYVSQKEFDAATINAEKAIELHNTSVQLYILRTQTFLIMKNYERALMDANEAIRLNSDYPEAYLARGVTYLRMGNYEKAIIDFTRVIEHYYVPNLVAVYGHRGRAFHRQGNFEQAIADYKKAQELHPNYLISRYFIKIARLRMFFKNLFG